MRPRSRRLLLFGIYAAVLLWLLFDRSSDLGSGAPYRELLRSHMNLIPFHTIGNYWTVVRRGELTPLFYHCLINLGGNIFLFIPIGAFLPALWPGLRKFLPFVLACALAITAVELLQLMTLLGSLDIDDLILNLFGMILGYGLFMILQKQR